MADRPEDRPLTPAEEDRVRRLLVEARHTEPIPDDVAARLDAVLAGLAAEGGGAADQAPAHGGPAGSPVADLAAARRRRRRVTQVLVAAAAVTVVGVAGPQLLGGAGDMMTADSESATSGDAGGAAEGADSAPNAAAQDGDSNQVSPPGDQARGGLLRELDADSLEQGAAALRKAAGTSTSLGPVESSPAPTASAIRACRGEATWGAGGRVLVRYDGADAVLVYRPTADDTQQVALFLCGQSTPTRTLTLPAP